MDYLIRASLLSNECCIVLPRSSPSQRLAQAVKRCFTAAVNITPTVVQCTSHITLNEFNDSFTLADVNHPEQSDLRSEDSIFHSIESGDESTTDRTFKDEQHGQITASDRRIADVVITTDLDLAPADVQVQVIELLRTRRLLTRSSMHLVPKNFLLIATLSSPHARLTRHLNDVFAVSYLVSDEELEQTNCLALRCITWTSNELDYLRVQASQVNLTAEVDSYLHHIVLFMRLNRYVQGGVTAAATRYFRATCKALAVLQSLDFVTPSIVAQAARIVYPHRLVLATIETEKTLQWGSSQDAVLRSMKGVTEEAVIEDTIASVEAPL